MTPRTIPNFHQEWLQCTIDRMEERKKSGDMTVELQVGEFQHILRELLSMHIRCDRLEAMLQEFALYSLPKNITVTGL
jgi:hypothetical protein